MAFLGRVIIASGYLSGAGQQAGALSRVYDLMDNPNHTLLGTFHEYRNLDGSLGAFGDPDPIFLMVNGVPMCDP